MWHLGGISPDRPCKRQYDLQGAKGLSLEDSSQVSCASQRPAGALESGGGGAFASCRDTASEAFSLGS